MNIKNLLLFTLFILFFSQCKKDTINPENIFAKIYDDSNSDLSYYPLSIIQSSDGGYYILNALSVDTTRQFLNTHIIRTDMYGELLWQATLPEPYVSPVEGFVVAGNELHFLCMDRTSLGTYLMKVDDANQSAVVVESFNDIVYPLAASQTPDNGFLLLNYDRDSRSSQLTKFTATFSAQWDTKFSVVEDAEAMLIAHMTRSGKVLPFFTGTIGSGSAYFVNALYNYSLALLFVDANNGDRTGLIFGERYDAGISAAVNIQGESFAASRFVFSSHYILPTVNFSLSSIISASDLSGESVAELADDAHTRIKVISVDNQNLIVYASNTQNNQVLLLFYDLTTGELVKKTYLGSSNPVKVADLIQTADGGVAILTQTTIAGRFKRVALYKIPKEQILGNE